MPQRKRAESWLALVLGTGKQVHRQQLREAWYFAGALTRMGLVKWPMRHHGASAFCGGVLVPSPRVLPTAFGSLLPGGARQRNVALGVTSQGRGAGTPALRQVETHAWRR